jgi:predicted amidohydrolase
VDRSRRPARDPQGSPPPPQHRGAAARRRRAAAAVAAGQGARPGAHEGATARPPPQPSAPKTRIACRQLAPRIADLAANRALSTAAIREAVAGGAGIVLLPELVTSGYVFTSPEEAASVAVTAEHELFGEWAAEAARGGAVVIAGFAEQGDDGNVYNSAAVVDGTGVLAVYRKAHLWDREKLVFTPGAAPPPVVDTPAGRIGVLVCYDLEFPEMTRSLALRGADLIAVPTNWPAGTRPAGERPAEVVIAQATARINRVFVACCDRTGAERGQEWTAGTAIVDEAGWVLDSIATEGEAAADVDLTRARDKTWTEFSDALADRRPELYGDLTAQPART